MGYDTEFSGKIDIVPALKEDEISYLKAFANTRRMLRKKGPYYCGKGFMGQEREPDVLDFNAPDDSQPGLWCQWEPSDDGTSLAWNGKEKFYDADEWMAYLIDEFLTGKKERHQEAIKKGFIPAFGYHVCNGVIEAQGEEIDDRWTLTVEDNVVTRTDRS